MQNENNWDGLPEILTPVHLKTLSQVARTCTLTAWVNEGRLPRPVIKSGNIIRWRKEDVRAHLERRAHMGY